MPSTRILYPDFLILTMVSITFDILFSHPNKVLIPFFIFFIFVSPNFISGLSVNTKKNISKRAETEDNMIITKSDTYDSMLEGQDGYILKSKDFKSIESDAVDEKDE